VISALEKLCGPGKALKAEPCDPTEFKGLVESGNVRLRDAQGAKLALESRFDLAYNAAHALCLAAIRRHGHRSTQRYIVFQVLPHTLGLGPEVWRVLSKCTTFAISANTRVRSRSMPESWPISFRRARR
jgi:hypothetical protein